MSALSSDKKPHVDYGVQIRFIKDLHDTGGGFQDKSRGKNAAPSPNKYGVAVRVQGISGQPYVVLKDGEKGDSYGVQLNTPTPSSGPPSPYNSLPRVTNNPTELAIPFRTVVNPPHSPVSHADDEEGEIFGSPLRRPPGDGQAGTQAEEEVGAGIEKEIERSKIKPQYKATPNETERKKDPPVKEEYNDAGLKPVRFDTSGSKGINQTNSLGRFGEKKHSIDSSSQSFPQRTESIESEPVPAIDTKSLAPINKLISKFNNGTPGSSPQTRGRSGARQRLQFDEHKRSRSLEARKDAQPEVLPPSSTSPTPKVVSPSTSIDLPISSTPVNRSPSPFTKVTTPAAPKTSFKAPEKFVPRDTPPAISKKPEILPKSFSQNPEVVRREDAPLNKASLNKDSTSQSERYHQREVSLPQPTPDRLKKEESDGDVKKEKLEELQEQLKRFQRELQEGQDELTTERMARELAESRLRLQEDQLAQLQEELRRISENSPQTDAVTLQAQLAEAALLHQRQEEVLHQRERELTALKGALKEEVECHDKEMEVLREQYSQDMESLRKTMEQFTQSQEEIEMEREKVNASMLKMEEELEDFKDQGEQWKSELDATTQELNDTKEKLKLSCLEKENMQETLKDLQESLSSAKKDPPAHDNHSLAEELRRCQDNLKQTRAALDKEKRELEKKNKALEELKKASGEKEAELQSEISRLKEQMQNDKAELEKAKEASSGSSGKTVVDHGSQELQEANVRLREKLARMTRLQSSLPRSSEAEEELEALDDENRSLKTQLEEAKRGANRLSKERDELTRRLEERELEREALKRGKSDLEEQKRLLDRALEKISKEMEVLMGDSRQSVASLQTQLEEFRERSRKDLQEAQRNNKERLAELQRVQSSLKTQQDEVSRLKKELLLCSEERDSAQLERDLFNNRLKHLEEELETEKNSHTDRSREIRGLEDKIKTLEIDLDEEKSGVELLNDRITRSRDQMDQLRSELMQERSVKHDLEMDKSTLERQVKDLKSRLADLEVQSRPSAGITLLENKVQELEERLRSEEREKASIQASLRRMERKLKEVNAMLDEERSQHTEQKDQLSLRVKALKRQVDESEGEVERLEGVRRKGLRDLEEQHELQEVLRAKVTALENELKRRSQPTHRLTMGTSILSSEEEEGFYDNNINTILNENHLQTNNS